MLVQAVVVFPFHPFIQFLELNPSAKKNNSIRIFYLADGQKSAEPKIILQKTEGPFCLNGTAHSQKYTVHCCNMDILFQSFFHITVATAEWPFSSAPAAAVRRNLHT